MRYLQDLNQAAFGNALNLSDVVKPNSNIEIRMYISPSYIVIKILETKGVFCLIHDVIIDLLTN